MRTFYRDLSLLAEYKIDVRVSSGRYRVAGPLKDALDRLPFPPPKLSFGDVMELIKGRGAAHAKLRAQLQVLTR